MLVCLMMVVVVVLSRRLGETVKVDIFKVFYFLARPCIKIFLSMSALSLINTSFRNKDDNNNTSDCWGTYC